MSRTPLLELAQLDQRGQETDRPPDRGPLPQGAIGPPGGLIDPLARGASAQRRATARALVDRERPIAGEAAPGPTLGVERGEVRAAAHGLIPLARQASR